ncbi:MAG TPA: serine hydrolase domain-containing protein [Candidatus Cybelea sp.]|nr:serine hydrolase domain-containing protein [Candidatus Cybelea sp.]
MRNRNDALAAATSTQFGPGRALPAARPEEVGLSAERLSRIDTVFEAKVTDGTIPGAIVAIARRGRIGYCRAFGYRDRAKAAPMHTDAIFRIASMTKPFTSVAAMILAEEGRLQLFDPVARHIPAFAGVKVAADAAGRTTIAPRAEMTVQDLLRHTSGMTRGLSAHNPVGKLYGEAAVQSRDQTLAEQSAKLARLPLAYHPASVWEYSVATDVLARVVEVASGTAFDAFLAERILQPLRLADTGFHVPEAQHERLAEAPDETLVVGEPKPFDARRPAKMVSGGGGMVSTMADYLRFGQMLLDGGTLEGANILAPKTVAYMTSDHLGPIARGATPDAYIPGPGYGFGLGFAVRTAQGLAPYPGSVGDFFWGGIFGTHFWADPAEQLIGLLMMQAPSQRREFSRLTRMLVYQSIAN